MRCLVEFSFFFFCGGGVPSSKSVLSGCKTFVVSFIKTDINSANFSFTFICQSIINQKTIDFLERLRQRGLFRGSFMIPTRCFDLVDLNFPIVRIDSRIQTTSDFPRSPTLSDGRIP